MNIKTGILFAFCLLAGMVSAQFLETTIFLPDSFGGLVHPLSLEFNPLSRLVYVGGEAGDCVIAFDARTGEKVARIPAGRWIGSLLYTSGRNKLYCANESSRTLTVVDCATNTPLRTLTTRSVPKSLCYNPVRGKVYYANYYNYYTDSTVGIIDEGSDSLLKLVLVDIYPVGFCYVDKYDRVYVGSRRVAGNICVIDGSGDSIVHKIQGIEWHAPWAFCYTPVDDKLYSASYPDFGWYLLILKPGPDTLSCAVVVGNGSNVLCYNNLVNKVYCASRGSNEVRVIDGKNDTVIAVVRVGRSPFSLSFNQKSNGVYCANADDGTISVIDGFRDSVRLTITVGVEPWALIYDSVDNRTFCANRGSHNVTIIEGDNDTVIGEVVLGNNPRVLCLVGESKVYCGNLFGGQVTVVDASTNRVKANLKAGEQLAALCYNPVSQRVFCANEKDGNVSVFDAVRDSLLYHIPVGSGPRFLCYNPLGNKVYCANYGRWPEQDSTVTVLNGETGEVIGRVVVGNRPVALCHNSIANKVYAACYGAEKVMIIDGAADTVIKGVQVGRYPLALCYNYTRNKVYCASSWADEVIVIDGVQDSVIKRVRVGGYPLALIYNPANGQVYCANRLDGTVSAIDCAADSVIATINLYGKPTCLSVDAMRNRVYCADSGLDRVWVIDGSLNQRMREILTGTDPVAMVFVPAYSRTYIANYNGSSLSVIRDTTLGIADEPMAPVVGGINRLYPSSGNVVIHFQIPYTGKVGLRVYDIQGRLVRTLISGEQKPGVYTVVWDGKDGHNRQGANGVYFYRLEAPGITETKKTVLMR